MPAAKLQLRRCDCGGVVGPDGRCDQCRARQAMLQRSAISDAESLERVPESVPEELNRSGEPLDPSIRRQMERQFRHDFSGVRLHAGTNASDSCRHINALAYTAGHHVVVGDGFRNSGNAADLKLLAHELTHVIQQSGNPDTIDTSSNGIAPEGSVHEREASAAATAINSGMTVGPIAAASPAIYLLRPESAITSSLSALSVKDATIDELDRAHALAKSELERVGSNAIEAQVLRENIILIERALTEVQGTSGNDAPARKQSETSGKGPQQVPPGSVPRPPGLQLGEGYVLYPYDNASAEVLAIVPEGKLTVISGSPPGPGAGPRNSSNMGLAETGLVSTGMGIGSGANSVLMSQGFAAAGPNAIGIVGMPSWDPIRTATKGIGPLLPESTSTLGHTAYTLRVNGQLVHVQGFTPASKTDVLGKLFAGITKGRTGTPGVLANDAWLFGKTSAQSIEWPISEQEAVKLLSQVEKNGKVPGLEWTGNPREYAKGPRGLQVRCVGTNCVLYAVDKVEDALGGKFATLTPDGPVPVTARGGGAGTASQGEFIKATSGKVGEIAPIEGVGKPVTAGMSSGMKVIKWGGRLFIVAGVAVSGYEVYAAKEEERTRTAIGAGAGLVGGIAGGAAAGAAVGLVCGPGAPVCSFFLALGGGIVGGLAARRGAEAIYDTVNE